MGKNAKNICKSSDSILTVLGASGKQVILTFFSRHDIIWLCATFQVYLTPPSGFWAAGNTFFTNMGRKYFSLNILTVGDLPEVEFLNFDQNWANTRPLLLKTLGPSKYSLCSIVHCVFTCVSISQWWTVCCTSSS